MNLALKNSYQTGIWLSLNIVNEVIEVDEFDKGNISAAAELSCATLKNELNKIKSDLKLNNIKLELN